MYKKHLPARKIISLVLLFLLIFPSNLVFASEISTPKTSEETKKEKVDLSPPTFSTTPDKPEKDKNPDIPPQPKKDSKTEDRKGNPFKSAEENNSKNLVSGSSLSDDVSKTTDVTNQNNVLEADSSGTLSYSYKFTLPPGRNGLTPDLSLVYNSNNREISSIAGFGWSFNIPSITRISRHGSDAIYDYEEFDSSLSGELEKVGSTSNFISKVDNGEFLTYSISNNKWLVNDKSGTQYLFGNSASARQDNASGTAIYRWMLEEVRDLNGNYITYEYYKDAGQIYPSKITYTGHDSLAGIFEIEFLRESISTEPKSFATGFSVQSNYRISEVRMEINNQWVRKYELDYTTGDNEVRNLLNTITESGRDDSGTVITLAPVDFDYSISTPGWTYASGWSLPFHWIDGTGGVDFGMRLNDINGDGLLDIACLNKSTDQNLPCNYANGPRVRFNNGPAGWSAPSSWLWPYKVDSQSQKENFVDTNFQDTGLRLVDVNGDLKADLIRGDSFSQDNYVYLNSATTTGWVYASGWDFICSFKLNGSDYGNRMIDFNGDGFADFACKNEGTNNPCSGTPEVKKHSGFGWSTLAGWNWPNKADDPTKKEAFANANFQDTSLRLLDINGDGLDDLVRAQSGTRYVYTNTGSGWTYGIWGGGFPLPFLGCTGEDCGLRTDDINGDGLIDLVCASEVNNEYCSGGEVYINTGTGWLETDWEMPPKQSNPNEEEAFVDDQGQDTGLRLLDINGDGLADLIRGNGSNQIYTYLNTGEKADYLNKITFSAGGSAEITYKSSPQYREDDELLNPKLPLVMYTVSQITRDDGFGNLETTDHTYRNGEFYFDSTKPQERKFSGFGIVEKRDALGNVTKTYFHQGNENATSTGEYLDHIAKAGKPYRIEQYDASGNLYSKTINKWDRYDLGNDASFIKLLDSLEFSYDGNSDHREKATRISYDNNSGNVSSQIEFGEVSGNDDGTFSDTGSDKFITSLSYATSTATSTITAPSRETVTDNSGNKVREKKIYYDTLSFGNLNKGNQTKEEQWKSGSSSIDIERTFNSYGLITEEKDPRDKATLYVYDTYNLYRATTTNPLSHKVDQYYDYSSGQVTKIVTPNGDTYENFYDSLDRIKEQKQPKLNTLSNPPGIVTETKTKYVYTDDIFPRQVKKTDYLTDTLTVDSYIYFDGLNRKIEERTEAENANTFKVRNFNYNSRGLLKNETLPFFATGSSFVGTEGIPSYLYSHYSYDPLSRITKIVNSLGSTTNQYYDWHVTTTDPQDNIKEFFYDPYGNLIEVVEHEDANAYETFYAWNGNKNLTKITDALGNVRNFTYDGLGRRLTAEDLHDVGDGTYGTWSYTFDDTGNITSQTDPKSQTTNFTYNDINQTLTEDYTGSGGTEIQYGYGGCTKGIGRLCVATSTGAIYKTTYNVLGLPATETKTIDSINYASTFTYDRQGDITNIKYPDDSEVSYAFNTAGFLEFIKQKEKNGSWNTVVEDFDYGPTDQVVYKLFENGIDSVYTYERTKLYRLTNILTAATSTSLLHSDPLDVRHAYSTDINVNDIPISDQVKRTAASKGLLVTGEIANQRTDHSRTFATQKKNIFVSEIISGVPQYFKDEKGEWWQIEYPTTPTKQKATSTISAFFWNIIAKPVFAQTTNTFYPNPHPESTSVDGYVRHRTGTAGTGINWVNLQSGAGTDASDSNAEDGSVAIEADTTTNKWRIIDRTIRVFDTSSIPDQNTILAATYFDSTQSKNIYNGGVGGTAYNVFSSSPASNTSLAAGDFDSLGTTTLSTEIPYDSIAGSEGSYNTWELNTSGTALISTTGATKLGIRESNFDAPNIAPTWANAAYENVTFNNAEETGTSKDPKLVVIHEDDTPNEPPSYPGIQDITFVYDAVGNITEIQDNSQTLAAKTIIFEYDDLHRLKTASTTSATSTPFRETYTYSSIGNITNKSDQGNYSYSETGYANPHAATAIGGTALSYDNNGNSTSFGGNSYTWDWRNRMTSASTGGTTTNYYYDHTEQRVKKVSNGQTSILPNEYFDKTGSTITKHVYNDRGGLISTIEGNGIATSTYYIHTDHLGGTNVVTDANGNTVEVTDYKPFGKINTHETSGTFAENKKYTGHTYDSSSDLNYMNARYQDGEMGRFLSQDLSSRETPEKFLRDPQQFNYYSYGRNNPVRFYDPNGEDVWDSVVGFFNSVLSNNALGAGRVSSNLYNGNQADYQTGQTAGDYASVIQGLFEVAAGSTIAGGGGAITVTSGGALAVAGVPAVVGGATVATHGATVAGTGFINLLQSDGRLGPEYQGFTHDGVEFSDHAARQMNRRGINRDQAVNTVKNGESFDYFHEGSWKNGYYDPKSKIFVGQGKDSGKITTTIKNVSRRYVNNLKSKKPQ